MTALQDLLETSKSLKSNPKGPEIDFKGKTVIITGAGAGLGRIYALMFGKMGANVVVNDVSKDGAQSVVNEVVKGKLTRSRPITQSALMASHGIWQLEEKLLLRPSRPKMEMALSRSPWRSSAVYTF